MRRSHKSFVRGLAELSEMSKKKGGGIQSGQLFIFFYVKTYRQMGNLDKSFKCTVSELRLVNILKPMNIEGVKLALSLMSE